MNLVIFDIDGTLTRTLLVDEECYTQAFADEFDITGFSTDWGAYDHYTDSGIAEQIYSEHTGSSIPAPEHQRLIERFVFLLSSRNSDQPGLFEEVPGASGILEQLRRNDIWKAALATGCWLESARFKLRTAGLDFSGLPMATADDSMVRSKIFRIALKRARSLYKIKHFDRVVYVGDGTWDVRMCSELRHPFIGVATEKKTEELANLGARSIIPDYLNQERFFSELETADIPGSKT